MGNERIEMYAIIHGQVQGVGFRATAVHFAKQLNLQGTVRNCPGNNVEIHAQGKKIDLITFLEQLKQSFRIISIDTEFSPDLKIYNEFKIIY